MPFITGKSFTWSRLSRDINNIMLFMSLVTTSRNQWNNLVTSLSNTASTWPMLSKDHFSQVHCYKHIKSYTKNDEKMHWWEMVPGKNWSYASTFCVVCILTFIFIYFHGAHAWWLLHMCYIMINYDHSIYIPVKEKWWKMYSNINNMLLFL